MSSYRIDAEQIAELRLARRRVRDAALADRIKAVVLLGSGWKPVKVAEALLVDVRTVRTHFQKFQNEDVDDLLFRAYVGKEPYLTPKRQAGLAECLDANPGRRRLNINGALNAKSRSLEVVYSESVNLQSTIELFDRLESLPPRAKRIIVVADNARYYHSRLIQEYLKTIRIQIIFLPPNLNLIELVWKFFKKKVTNNAYYETYDSFLQACSNFFQRWKTFDAELRSLLTESFQTINVT